MTRAALFGGGLCMLLAACSSSGGDNPANGGDSPAWAIAAGGMGAERANGVAGFADRSCVVVGIFAEDITFGPGAPTETELISSGINDVFVARFDPTGRLLWAQRAGGPGDESGGDVTALPDGSCVVAGFFEQTAVFAPGEPEETELTAAGLADVYVVRYGADGTLLWVRRAGGEAYEACRGVAGFPDGSCVITGYFDGAMTFGPGEPNETTLTNAGDFDVFVARYNADGTLAWAKQAGGDLTCSGNDLAAFADGSCVVGARIEGTVTFGAGEANETEVTVAGGQDVAVARYHANGTLAWVRRAGGTGGDTPWGVATYADGSCVVTGSFGEVATFGPGEANETDLTAVADADVFVARFGADGALAWATQAGGALREVGRNIASFSDGSFVVAGYFRDVATFGPGEANETALTSAGELDAFVARYAADGTLRWVEQVGSTLEDQGEGLATFADGSCIVAGRFKETVVVHEGDLAETTLASLDDFDLFVARYRVNGD